MDKNLISESDQKKQKEENRFRLLLFNELCPYYISLYKVILEIRCHRRGKYIYTDSGFNYKITAYQFKLIAGILEKRSKKVKGSENEKLLKDLWKYDLTPLSIEELLILKKTLQLMIHKDRKKVKNE